MSQDKPTNDDEWISKIGRYVELGTDWNERKQIQTNVNYYLGNQWLTWDPTRRVVQEAAREAGAERITHNVIKPRVMTKLAKQTKNRIKYDVMPDTNDQTRIEVAKGATKFMHFWWDQQEMDRNSRDIHLNNNVKAWCAAKVWFDSESGEDITPSKDSEFYEEGVSVHTGEILCRICDPLTLYIDPSATNDSEIRWIVEEKPRDIEYIKARYGKEVSEEDNVSYLPQLISSGPGIGSQSSKKSSKMAMIRELWIAPCAEYPNGMKVTATKDQVLDVSDDAGDLPYIIFGDIPTPGSVKYTAFIQDMLPIQRNLNIALSAIATTFKRMGGNKWIVPIGSGIDEDELDDTFDGIIHYNPIDGAKPERAQAPDMPSMFDRIIEYYNRLIDDMSGAREITTGRLPAGLDTASGLALMVEQENEKLAVNAQNYERGMKKLLKRVLRLMKKHYTEERLGRILGPDNEIELVSFLGADLSGEEDINIVQGSSLPEMRSAQEDRIMSLWGANAIVKKDGTPDHETLLRLMGMGDSTELFEQHRLDENNAKMENKEFLEAMEDPQMLAEAEQWYAQYQQIQQLQAELNQQLMTSGIPPESVPPMEPPPFPSFMPQVWDSDDDDVHLYNHNSLRKGSEYRKKMSPALRALVDIHFQQHLDKLQAPIIAQQQAEMAAQQKQMQSDQDNANAERQHQQAMKKQDQDAALQRDMLKSQTAMAQAAMKTKQA
jgi:hypothetical protein